MPEPPRNAFQYAIVRVVPRVERGECLNVGVVLLCRPTRFLGARIALDERRLAALRAGSRSRDDPAAPRRDRAGRRRATRRPDRSRGLGQAERFHWLVAPSSTIIQPSDGPHRAVRRPGGRARPPRRDARRLRIGPVGGRAGAPRRPARPRGLARAARRGHLDAEGDAVAGRPGVRREARCRAGPPACVAARAASRAEAAGSCDAPTRTARSGSRASARITSAKGPRDAVVRDRRPRRRAAR